MSYTHVKNWRKRIKQRMVEAMGGCCQCCGYNKCIHALQFHHLNPEDKEVALSSWSYMNWTKITNELKKCILVCSNCHQEIHAGVREIPQVWSKFNKQYQELETPKYKKDTRRCLTCKKPFETVISSKQQFCSYKCSHLQRHVIDWNKINFDKELKTKNINQLANELEVSWHTVNKHYLRSIEK